MQRRRIVFSGRVQGVGFRATARSLAAGFPITGWVRNEPDDTVLLEIQGDPREIEAFLARLRSRMGRLILCEDSSAIPIDELEPDFEVRH